MSRCRESSGASFGSQITPPAESSSGKRLRQHAQLAEVGQRGVPAHVALADERRPVHRAEHHVVAADVHGVRRVAGLHVELPRRLGHLLEHELRVEADHLAVDPSARPWRNSSTASGLANCTPISETMRRQPASRTRSHPGEDLVPRHPVDGTSTTSFQRDRRVA